MSLQFRGWVLGLDERASLHLSSPLKPTNSPRQEPLSVRVQAAFFRAAPAQAVIQDYMRRALSSLQATEGLQLEIPTPVLGQCLSLCSLPLSLCCSQPYYVQPSGLPSYTQHFRAMSAFSLPVRPQGTLALRVLGTATTPRSLLEP